MWKSVNDRSLVNIAGSRVLSVWKSSDNDSCINLCEIPDSDENSADIELACQAGDIVAGTGVMAVDSLFSYLLLLGLLH